MGTRRSHIDFLVRPGPVHFILTKLFDGGLVNDAVQLRRIIRLSGIGWSMILVILNLGCDGSKTKNVLYEFVSIHKRPTEQ